MHRSFLLVPALLAAPLLTDLGADAVAPVAPQLAETLDAAGAAEAAFIRRGKLKQRPSYGYKVVVVAADEAGDSDSEVIDTVEVSFPSGGFASVNPSSRTARRRIKKQMISTLQTYTAPAGGGTTGTFTGTVGDELVSVEVPLEEGLVNPGDTTVLVSGLGWQANLRMTNNGIRANIVHEDKTWDPDTLIGFSLSSPDGEPVDFETGAIIGRYVWNLSEDEVPAGFGPGSSYTMNVVAKNADGQVVDTSTQTLVLGDEPADLGLGRVRVKASRGGQLRVITDVDGLSQEKTTVQVVAYDSAGNNLIDVVDDMAARESRLYGDTTLTFEDPNSIIGQPVGVVLNLRDGEGNSLGASDYEVVVEGLDEPDVTPVDITIATTEAEELRGRLNIRQLDPTNFAVSVILYGGSAEVVDVELTDLIGNPALPEALSLPVAYQFRRFVTEGTDGLGTLPEGGTGTVDVLLLDETGEVIGVGGGTFGTLPETVNPGTSRVFNRQIDDLIINIGGKTRG